MKITRNLLSALCVLLGLATLIGYFIVILPKGTSSLPEVIFGFTFAVLFIIGGFLAIKSNNLAIPMLILACTIYAIVGLYKPILIYGLSGFSVINQQFYVSLSIRVGITIMLSIILIKQRVVPGQVYT